MVLPRLLRVASFRFAVAYVVVFAVSVLILGATVFLQARSTLERQTVARIEKEVSLLTKDYRNYGLPHLIQVVEERGRHARTFEYLVTSPAGEHLGGNIPTAVALKA